LLNFAKLKATKGKGKGGVFILIETLHRATERHLPCGITQC